MIRNKLAVISENIKKTADLYNQDSSKINLVAVTKKQEKENILTAIDAGVKIFGENYVQEAQEKWPELKTSHPDISLHMIGNLQSNKIKEAVELFDCIQTLDRESLATALSKYGPAKKLEYFVQVNIGEEKTKSGVLPYEVADFVSFTKNECALNVTGLMCIPPESELASPYFALMHKFARQHSLPNLSMGMSADYEEAIALGANFIRLGTAIFGQRITN